MFRDAEEFLSVENPFGAKFKFRNATVEDKDPNILWSSETLCAYIRLYIQFSQSGRWVVRSCPLESMLSFYRLMHRHHLPRCLRPQNDSFTKSSLPYVYGTYKMKCWGKQTGRIEKTCVKPQHSCMRNISSFFTFVGRDSLRYATRALGFLASTVWPGFAYTNLSVAPQETRDDIRNVVVHASPSSHVDGKYVCKLCGTRSHAPSAFVGDAGQAYETIAADRVLGDCKALFAEATRRGLSDSIAVKKGKKPQVSFGGSIKTNFLDRIIFTRNTLMRFACCVLMMRSFVFGWAYAVQLTGIPTGGPWSGMFLELTLGRRETYF